MFIKLDLGPTDTRNIWINTEFIEEVRTNSELTCGGYCEIIMANGSTHLAKGTPEEFLAQRDAKNNLSNSNPKPGTQPPKGLPKKFFGGN
jgi:hypothetical protein